MNWFKILNFMDNRVFKLVNFIYLMTLYHILIIVFSLILQKEISAKTFILLSLDFGYAHSIIDLMSIVSIKNVLFALIIIIIDLLLLFIIANEFKGLKLNIRKITIIEIIIFILSLSHPIIRLIMLFLSLNTFQIVAAYKIMKKISLTKYLFITGSIIYIIKLVLLFLYELYFWIYFVEI